MFVLVYGVTPHCKGNKSHSTVNPEKKKPPKTNIYLPILIDILFYLSQCDIVTFKEDPVY